MRCQPLKLPRLFSAVLALCAAAPAAAQAPRPNFVLVVLDDVGVEQIASFGLNPNAAATPTLDRLAAQGLRFSEAWANPVCSSTRATLLTGRYGFRTGIGRNVNDLHPYGLPPGERTLPALLAPDYASTAIGKWHLAGALSLPSPPDHPVASGFQHFRGVLENLDDYYLWDEIEDGAVSTSTRYQTRELADDAIASLAAMREPWLLYLAFNAPHAPFHVPPSDLFDGSLPAPPSAFPAEHYRAALEAVDRELGRVLDSIPPEVAARTVILAIGDNGSPRSVVEAPAEWAQHKGSVYQGGIRVPLIVASPALAPEHRGAASTALVSSVDVFATIAELAGRDPGAIDGVSLTPYFSDPARPSIRSRAFAERFMPNGPGPRSETRRALRDARYKLIREDSRDVAFFDLAADPFEHAALRTPFSGEAVAAYLQLRRDLDALVSDPCESDGDSDAICDRGDNCLGFRNPDQRDSDADGFGNACDADFDQSGAVGFGDFIQLRAAFETQPGDLRYQAEFDLSGGPTIGIADLQRFARLLGGTPGPSALLCAGSDGCGAR